MWTAKNSEVLKHLKVKKCILIMTIFSLSCGQKNSTENKAEFDLGAMVQAVPAHSVLKDPNYFVWGASMVKGDDGLYHLFYSRWPKAEGFQGWLDYSEIAYATAISPDGPYEHKKVLLKGFGKGHWNEQSAHNPHIKKFNGQYYLYFISHTNEDFGRNSEIENHRWGQRIGVAVAKNPAGPWKVSEKPLIDYQEGKGAEGYMVNPSVCQKPDGSYLMIFKTRSSQPELEKRMIQCMATAKNPEGPFTIAKAPILTDKEVEDPFLWFQDGRYYAILDDQQALYTGHHGLVLFTSNDGEKWDTAKNASIMRPEIVWEDGSKEELRHLERPQVWLNDKGEPAMLFCAAMLKENSDTVNLTFNVHIPLKKTKGNK